MPTTVASLSIPSGTGLRDIVEAQAVSPAAIAPYQMRRRSPRTRTKIPHRLGTQKQKLSLPGIRRLCGGLVLSKYSTPGGGEEGHHCTQTPIRPVFNSVRIPAAPDRKTHRLLPEIVDVTDKKIDWDAPLVVLPIVIGLRVQSERLRVRPGVGEERLDEGLIHLRPIVGTARPLAAVDQRRLLTPRGLQNSRLCIGR